jgi:diguanylate cyclase (GGDEF)-like protein
VQRSLWLLLTFLAIFLFLAGLSVVVTVREVDNFDSQRTRKSVEIAVHDQILRIGALVADNAFWDDAALAVNENDVVARNFTYETWGTSTIEQRGYSIVSLYTPRQGLYATFHNGVPSPPADRVLNAKIQAVVSRLSGKLPVSGSILEDHGTLYYISVGRIRPTSPILALRLETLEPRYLVMMEEMNQRNLDGIRRSLSLQKLTLGRTDPTAVPLKDMHGHIVGNLKWENNRPGIAGLTRAVPTIAMALSAAILLTIFVLSLAVSGVKRLEFQALHDGLSKLPNRRALMRQTATTLADKTWASVAMIDLDGFKAVNDLHGHGVGDALIKAISLALSKELAEECTLARLGGDEFAILCGGLRSEEQLANAAEQALDRIRQPFVCNDRWLRVSASIGLATLHQSEGDANELLRRADVAMYIAKRAGKSRIVSFDAQFDQDRESTLEIELELREAIARDELYLVYQPVITVANSSIGSVEALLRWRHPERGLIPPDIFIPIAEESGLIGPLGLFVLRQACLDCLNWANVMLSVNVSPAQLRAPEFPDEVARILRETNFSADRLDLEITETYLVDDPDTALHAIEKLSRLGVRISLEDFGSGFASIGFLRKFPFDRLKIDRSLVTDSETCPVARSLILACAALARSLNMTSVAEGVETSGQADLMNVIGIDEAQGWWFSKAIPADEIEIMLSDHVSSSFR